MKDGLDADNCTLQHIDYAANYTPTLRKEIYYCGTMARTAQLFLLALRKEHCHRGRVVHFTGKRMLRISWA